MSGYGSVKPRFEKYFKHLRDRKSAGPHDPKNAKQQALEKQELQELEEQELEPLDTVDVYIVLAQTFGMDERIHSLQLTREAASEMVTRLLASGEWNDARIVIRTVEFPPRRLP